jgi:hypothetical protein
MWSDPGFLILLYPQNNLRIHFLHSAPTRYNAYLAIIVKVSFMLLNRGNVPTSIVVYCAYLHLCLKYIQVLFCIDLLMQLFIIYKAYVEPGINALPFECFVLSPSTHTHTHTHIFIYTKIKNACMVSYLLISLEHKFPLSATRILLQISGYELKGVYGLRVRSNTNFKQLFH